MNASFKKAVSTCLYLSLFVFSNLALSQEAVFASLQYENDPVEDIYKDLTEEDYKKCTIHLATLRTEGQLKFILTGNQAEKLLVYKIVVADEEGNEVSKSNHLVKSMKMISKKELGIEKGTYTLSIHGLGEKVVRQRVRF